MMTLHDLLDTRSDQIVRRFVTKVKQAGSAPPGVTTSQLVDHIPIFLRSLARRFASDGASESSLARADAAAREHAGHTWKLGYDLAGLVREYGHLRQAIIELAQECDVALTFRDFDVLGRCLNDGIAEAVTEYVRFRDRRNDEQTARLEFLARAGELLASSLDYRSTLSRLTGLIVPRLADWCVVHLDGQSADDMAVAHVDPSKSELVREIYRRHPFPPGSLGDDEVVIAGGKPQLVSPAPARLDSSAHTPRDKAMVALLNARSWLTVPLSAHERTFGALTLVYSDSDRDFVEADVAFANDLARRAAIAIDNAHLFQLSQQARSTAEAAARAKDQFVAMVSHELRTPLNAILGWTRLIRGGGLDAEKQAHALEVIQRNAEAQNRLVADLLDISRTMTGKIRINPAQVDLAAIVDLTVADMHVALDAKRLELVAELDRGQATLRGDGERLQQIVWNLLSNAIKFTPKGGNIRVELRREASDLVLVVSDTGIGISSEFLQHVFEPFSQSNSTTTRQHGGLGLGLSITKHLVDLHGGRIDVMSEGIGRGSAFVVRLPVSALISPTVGVGHVAATTGASEANRIAGADLAGLRVLVVDDDMDARELIGLMLESCGAGVETAASAAAALAAMALSTPDVLISDIGMPEQDGYFLIRALRTAPLAAHNQLPAIALTAFTQNEDRTKALVAGFNLHLSKPVEPAVLMRAVASLAGRPMVDEPTGSTN